MGTMRRVVAVGILLLFSIIGVRAAVNIRQCGGGGFIDINNCNDASIECNGIDPSSTVSWRVNHPNNQIYPILIAKCSESNCTSESFSGGIAWAERLLYHSMLHILRDHFVAFENNSLICEESQQSGILSSSVCNIRVNACPTLHWASDPDDKAVLYACAQSSLSLPWSLLLGNGDVIESVQWFFSGRSQEVIATEVHGMVLVAPSFSGRVSKTNNVGVILQHVQVQDSGNYSVEVFVRNANGDVITLQRSAFVHITDGLPTTDGHLHVRQLDVAEYDNHTKQYRVALSCGTFLYPANPPFTATWLSPTGQTLPSSGYENGHFYLLLPNPVQVGSFTCQVAATEACIHSNSPSSAVLTVDALEARVAVVEAQLSSLGVSAQQQSELTQLQTKQAALEAKNNALENEVHQLRTTLDNCSCSAVETNTSALRNDLDLLRSRQSSVEAKCAGVETKTDVLETVVDQLKANETARESVTESREASMERMCSSLQNQSSALEAEISQLKGRDVVHDDAIVLLRARQSSLACTCKSLPAVTTVTGEEVLTCPFQQATLADGWTVIQRRCDGSEDFNRTWDEYSAGFGNPVGEFWFGLEKLHRITSSQNYELRFDLQQWDGTTGFALFSNFSIGPRSDKYRLRFVKPITAGNLTDYFSYSNWGEPFSTWDKDNDRNSGNCALIVAGGWWFWPSCSRISLNSPYQNSSLCPSSGCIHWYGFGPAAQVSQGTALRTVEMKIRPML